ncbi:MAG: HlyD family efflux transporter periplasmic adaptor subunit [Rothia sp. (in: high G+C Gram-positive bacteria)]|nr:HlyD family efflux transporter periplasmic adaptor subunit [Rothia sp. (in: high G+C Gram-positive bacteria)]
MSTLSKVLIGLALGIIALIAIGALLINSIFGSGTSAHSTIPSSDYLTLSDEGVSNKVRVDGTVQPGEIRSITTHLTSPVSSVEVEVGDRVELGQTLATIDTSTLQGDLDTQRTQLDGSVTTAQSALNAAQTAYDQYSQGIANGTNPEILAALAAQRTANEQVTLAAADLKTKQQMRDQAAAAGEDLTLFNADVAAAESALRLANGAKTDADTGVTTARAAANTQLAALETELNNARTALASAETTRNQTVGALQSDLTSATLTSPINGVVMSVAKPGAPASGPVVTIGDDSTLTITTSVREADVATIKEGNRVTFTAGATGSKEYAGTVTSVASIADSAQQGNDEAAGVMAGNGSAPTFTATIEVTGNREGLYLGSSVKASIITSEEESSLAVPLDAVYTNDLGKKSIVVAVPNDDGSFTLEERPVETGLANEFDISLTSGEVASGDMVLTPGETYRHRVGEKVTLDAGTSFGW